LSKKLLTAEPAEKCAEYTELSAG